MQPFRSQGASRTNEAPAASALHALVATPAVGSVLLLFVVVGVTALTLGMLSGLATRRVRRHDVPRNPA